MMETYKIINISAEYQQFCMKPSEEGSFSKLVEMSPRSGILQLKLTKTKYLSGISTVLHETFRRGLIFPSRLK